MKNIWNKNSKLLIIICLLENILSIYSLIYFGYMDRMNYVKVNDLALLIQNMYTSTWWALIICFICLLSIFTLTSIIYKKNDYHFISILIWVVLLILTLDFTKSIKYNISSIAIIMPIIVINIIAYNKQKSITKK